MSTVPENVFKLKENDEDKRAVFVRRSANFTLLNTKSRQETQANRDSQFCESAQGSV